MRLGLVVRELEQRILAYRAFCLPRRRIDRWTCCAFWVVEVDLARLIGCVEVRVNVDFEQHAIVMYVFLAYWTSRHGWVWCMSGKVTGKEEGNSCAPKTLSGNACLARRRLKRVNMRGSVANEDHDGRSRVARVARPPGSAGYAQRKEAR